MKARPVPQFTREITAHATAAASLTPGALPPSDMEPGAELGITQADVNFALHSPRPRPQEQRFGFTGAPIEVEGNAAVPVARFPRQTFAGPTSYGFETAAADRETADADAAEASNIDGIDGVIPTGARQLLAREVEGSAVAPAPGPDSPSNEELSVLHPLGQVQNSFIIATTGDTLWIIDQHVAHERILFEKVLRERASNTVESQRLLMPLIVELTPGQQAVFADIADELQRNGFEVEPFGSRTIAVKTSPAGVEAADLEHMLYELLEQFEREQQAMNIDTVRREIAASIACHAAIKVNTPLTPDKMEWLLKQLAQTECPMSCPHGRPIVLRYSVRDIQKAFKRI
jgi:DNA mismatch repair protein MutL